MLSHCAEIELHELKPGDYVVLGPDPGKHACVVLSVDDPGNPILTSHGQEKGPLSIALKDESPAHPPPVRFLSAGIK